MQRYKFRGSSGKVNLALDALPDFTALPGAGPHLRGAISISPSVDYMERAYDEAKYGRFSRSPYIDIVIPSLTDPSVAPPGKHVMSCFVQYAPYHLTEGTWDEQREAFGDTVIDTIAEYAPNLRDIILHRQVLTPLDLEREWGLSEGNIFQGELTLEQLFFLRPVPGWAQYRTPIAQPLHVRLGDASRRRHHGRTGAECGDEDPCGYQVAGVEGRTKEKNDAAGERSKTLSFGKELTRSFSACIGRRAPFPGGNVGLTSQRQARLRAGQHRCPPSPPPDSFLVAHDVVIIGAGHNGLVAAFYLAKAGLKPLVLERRETVGGGAITGELHPGFRARRCRTRSCSGPTSRATWSCSVTASSS